MRGLPTVCGCRCSPRARRRRRAGLPARAGGTPAIWRARPALRGCPTIPSSANLSGLSTLWNSSKCWQPASLRDSSQRGLKAWANSAPLPGAAVIETTRRTAMLGTPLRDGNPESLARVTRGRLGNTRPHHPGRTASAGPSMFAMTGRVPRLIACVQRRGTSVCCRSSRAGRRRRRRHPQWSR